MNDRHHCTTDTHGVFVCMSWNGMGWSFQNHIMMKSSAARNECMNKCMHTYMHIWNWLHVTSPSHLNFSFCSRPLLASSFFSSRPLLHSFPLLHTSSHLPCSPPILLPSPSLIHDVSARVDDAIRFISKEQKQSSHQAHTQPTDTSYISSHLSSASHLSLPHSHTLSIAVVDIEGAINRKVSFTR